MIGYVTLGTNDFETAASFYDDLLAVIDASREWDTDRFITWSNGKGASVSLVKPYDGEPASAGNGTMVALRAGSTEKVDAVYT